MLTISSIAVAPSPQATPVVRAQPVTPVRPGNAVARDAAAPAQVTPQGEAGRVQAAATPPLAPVAPAQETQRPDPQVNAAAPERAGLPPAQGRPEPGPREQAQAAAQQAQQDRAERARAEDAGRRAEERRAQARGEAQRSEPAQRSDAQDEGYPPVKNPALEALDTQIKELLPNLWKASRTAVDMVIGEEARKAAAERAQKLEELHQRLNARPLASLPPGEPQQSYGVAADGAGRDAKPGPRIDRLV
ncbi:hypothetical protein Tsedi_01459 [Tepidimonas sediminis]|uniref:Uncharacterized protein n=1 Tax=Tepidimonas sediminis TaxID=2588941 RepID=A0A554WNR7_9BURK|nr:hypothetical protein [Tepidimonas sediminis]TSE25213.1 hypothetical protein Tsedi_01459 [Tepidimonas sediminis]